MADAALTVGNLIEERSKSLKISYDWRGVPVEFRMETKAGKELQPTRSCSRDSVRVLMAYDGVYAADWERELVTHYTGIGTEVRESYRNNALEKTKVVVNMPQGLGRYGVEDAANPDMGFGAGYIPSTKFEWYLKNHLGSTMLVYGTGSDAGANGVKAAYDYRATVVAMRTKQQVAKCCPPFGEQVSLMEPTDKVTENFTGKERDDETQLSNHGARMLDPMLGIWISVDPKRFFPSPYLYMGNGYNPIRFADLNGERPGDHFDTPNQAAEDCLKYYSSMSNKKDVEYFVFVWKLNDGKYATNTKMFEGSVDAFGEEQILSAAQKNLPMDFDYVVAGAHLHGGVNQEYDSERFSEADYSNFVKPLSIDLYLMTPEESFQRMDVDGNVEFLKEMPEIDVK
ncbi:MAG: DUF4329 domain-containing protein [Fibrobacter sp.]|nr:DUF4329 domain-containing protein [Fibrobacter sp.]